MNQWYKNNITKGILIVVAHVLAVVSVVSFIWIMAAPALIGDLFSGKPAKEFKDSTAFSENVQSATHNILGGIEYGRSFETEGKYDPDRIVDIKEFNDASTVSNKNSSGLAYRLGDLENWGEKMNGRPGEFSDQDDSIIVCKKSDGTYKYYHYNDFASLIKEGHLKFVIADESENSGIQSGDILSNLEKGNLYEGNSNSDFKGLQNEEGKIEFIDCWNYDGTNVREEYAPIGADSILDIVNNNPEWNGRLNEVCEMLNNTIYSISAQLTTYRSFQDLWREGDTNLAYLYVDNDTKQIYTNRDNFKNYNNVETSIENIESLGKYVIVKPKLADFKTNLKGIDATDWRDIVSDSGAKSDDFIFAIGVDTTYPIQDSFYTQNASYEKYGAKMQEVAVLGLSAAVFFIIVMVWLTIIAGRTNRDEELHLNWFDRRKTELAALVVMLLWLIPMFFVGEFAGTSLPGSFDQTVEMQYDTINTTYYGYHQMFPNTVIGGVVAAYTCGMFLIGYLSLVRRIKAKNLWKNSIIQSLCSFIHDLFAHMNLVWKTVILFCAFLMIHWLTYMASGGWLWIPLMFIAELAAFVYLIQRSIGRQKIQDGIKHISSGEVEYKIPLEGLKGEQLLIAEKVNSIGEGLDAALEKSLKSERLKTDLITNVSHDIKTPLTSIINYIDLLKQEHFEDPKIQRYLEVLEAKAQRLKTLTEDVVEASKVSSGNITLEFMNINLVEMIQQTSGEFEEKFSKRSLKEVLNLPEEDALIRADGRRMWRVLENIYNNAAKYAMEGTRVYADLDVTDTLVIFSLKNVSEQPLNITADELTERFIRGDVSRSTEGSGLGLSIAKSLTSMQGGTFDLYLDGDLFKVTLTFPRIIKSE